MSKKTLKKREFSSEMDLLKRIYANRGITDLADINTDLTGLLKFDELLNIHKAAEIIGEGIKAQKRFLIMGDFDTDGATSTALSVAALKAFGAEYIDYLIPNRFDFGYGLTPEIVEVAATRTPDILITVDNGISSHAGVEKAKQYGMIVVVTDHHLAGETLPFADVIVNPNQPGDNFQSKHLAGVGVIFYVMLAVRKYLNSTINMAQFLDLVALGTVADVVILDKNNRILVSQGIKRIRAGLGRIGINALIKASRREAATLRASDFGFALGPRLNAAGRLEEMSLGVACLLSENEQEAFRIAIELDSLNRERRNIQEDMLLDAEKLLKTIVLEKIPESICVYHPDFHQGVIGILAGRIKDKYHRPTFVFAKANETDLKASARSIPGLHLRDVLALIDAKYPGLMTKFGGHAMAAGLTLPEKNLDTFSENLNKIILETIDKNYFNNILLTDGELAPNDVNVTTSELLRDHSPWGQGFPEPLFEGCFFIVQQKLLNEKHLKLILKSGDIQIDAIAFNYPTIISAEKITIAYRLETNEYNHQKKVQLVIEYIEK